MHNLKQLSNEKINWYKQNARIDLRGPMANDAAYGVASFGVPSVFTTSFTPEIIRQVLPVLASDEIAPPLQVGDWVDTDVVFRKVIGSGKTAPYADYSVDGVAEVNSGFEDRQVYQYQEEINYGDLEIARMAKVGYDWISEKRALAAYVLANERNNIFFSGIPGRRTYGILNDPGLNPVVVFPNSAANPASPKWMYKTFTEIVHDIQLLFNSIVLIAGGNVTLAQNMPMYLMVAPADLTWLTTPNQFGFTALDWIRRTFPNLEVRTAPQYQVGDGSTGDYVQLILKELIGQPVVRNLYTYLYKSHGLNRHDSWFTEKISAGTAGAAITQPIGIATGIGA